VQFALLLKEGTEGLFDALSMASPGLHIVKQLSEHVPALVQLLFELSGSFFQFRQTNQCVYLLVVEPHDRGLVVVFQFNEHASLVVDTSLGVFKALLESFPGLLEFGQLPFHLLHPLKFFLIDFEEVVLLCLLVLQLSQLG